MQLEGLGQLKNSMTSLGIEPMTFLLVAVPQSTTLLRAPLQIQLLLQIKHTATVSITKVN
jgi:hypothetical protein